MDQALLPNSCVAPRAQPLASVLVWDEAIVRNPSWDGTSDKQPPHPPPVKSLHSHGDALHTFPRDRLDPKTLDPAAPCEEGCALLLSLPCGSSPPFADGLH